MIMREKLFLNVKSRKASESQQKLEIKSFTFWGLKLCDGLKLRRENFFRNVFNLDRF